jgi:AcrR family transcriptional regulator
MAAHVLAHGLRDASLRPLARAAQTSDRMLIYHFGSKDGLVSALLVHLAAEFEARLSGIVADRAFASVDAAVDEIVAAQMQPGVADYVRLWMEIVAASARGSAPHKTAGAAILAGLARWLSPRLPPDLPDPDAAAWDAIRRIEGAMVLWSLGLAPTGAQAART